jgi:hypothetical protein
MEIGVGVAAAGGAAAGAAGAAGGAAAAGGAFIELDWIRACLILFVIGFIVIINFRFK